MAETISVEIPAGMSVEAFLKSVMHPTEPQEKKKYENPCPKCGHQALGGLECRIMSSDCTTAVFNHKPPPRFWPLQSKLSEERKEKQK